jgi:hypothetical protein
MKEIRRRLWHQILVLDIFASVDRGTEPLLNANTLDTPAPILCNDEDFDETSTTIPTRDGICEMTFTLMAHAATTLTMRLSLNESSPTGETWQQRLELAQNLGKEFNQNYFRHCDPSQPFHRFVDAVGHTMISSSILRAVRPLQRHVSSVPPRVDSPFVLKLAVNAMSDSEAIAKDPEAEGWRWMVWVQWHALAVSLAGLCSIRDTELADAAWELVERAYERYSGQVADTRSGMLWRPIEKLYRKASAFRDGGESARRKLIAKALAEFPDRTPPSANASVSAVKASQSQVPSPVLSNFPSTQDEFQAGFEGLSALQGGDLSWMDWERIMEDISGGGVDPLVGGVQGMDMGLGVMSNVGMGGNGLGVDPNMNGGMNVDSILKGGGNIGGRYAWPPYPNANGV